jgi:hypothetical protein
MQRLRATNLVQTRQVPGMPGHYETVFEPGAVEYLERSMVVEPLPPGVFGK